MLCGPGSCERLPRREKAFTRRTYSLAFSVQATRYAPACAMNAKGMNAPSGRYTALGAVCAGTVVSGAALYQYSRNPNNFDKDGYSK